MCSGSEAGSYLRLIDFVYHSTLGLVQRRQVLVLRGERETTGYDPLVERAGFEVSGVRGKGSKRHEHLSALQ